MPRSESSGNLYLGGIKESDYLDFRTTVYNVRQEYARLLGHICDHDGNRIGVYFDKTHRWWTLRSGEIDLGVFSSAEKDDKDGVPFVQWPS